MSILLIAGVLLATAQAQPPSTQQKLQAMLSQDTLPSIDGKSVVLLSQRPKLQQFYQQRNYNLAWQTNATGKDLSAQLLRAIDASVDDGLDPSYPLYHKNLIQHLAKPLTTEGRVLRDLLLSDAFMTLGYHLFHGIAFGTTADILHRAIPRENLNMPKILTIALQQGEVFEMLEGLAPSHVGYQNLKNALRHYRDIASKGGWNEDPEAYLDLEQVKKRLSITGEFKDDLDSPLPLNHALNPDPIDLSWDDTETNGIAETGSEPEALIAAIKQFQRCQDIMVDGIIGSQTRIELAKSVQERIETIQLNLERWRWYGTLVDDNYIMVNIPDFSLQFVHDGQQLSMKVVVGQKKRQTPIMEARMSYLVYNPYWRIPKTILAEDILPKLKANKNYLNANQITLFSSADKTESHPLDSTAINWHEISKKGMLRYTFRKEPGIKNPLGTIKFMFPNSEDIYIHDTSARYLFKNKTLQVSSGCIRAEKPMQLAYEILSREQPEITIQSIYSQIQTSALQVIHLKKKLPVYITYQTAWADADGRLYLRKDLYGLDANLLTFMKKLENSSKIN
ncbi:MAG: L,D-transpeptidase family protein [Pseudomonadota bacterium]